MVKKYLVIFLVIVLSGCTVGPPTLGPKKVKEEQRVIQKNKIVLYGKVYPLKEIEVISPLSGRIQKIMVELDDYVEKGTPILYFDTTQLRRELLTVKSRLNKSRVELESANESYREDVRLGISEKEAKIRAQEAQLVFDNIKQKLKRMMEAYKEGAVSKQELEIVENEYVRANASLKVALLRANGLPEKKRIIAPYQANVMADETEYAQVLNKLEEATIKALISGFITEIDIYEDQKVYEGWKLMKIVDINHVIVEAKISPGLLRFVYPGQDAEVVINTVPPTKFSSKIDSIKKISNSDDQMCSVRIILANKDFTIQPGFTTTVEITPTKEK